MSSNARGESDAKGFCQVCGAKSHGAHFQVQTCRACAAFFRRTCAYSRTYKCRRAMKNCDVSKNATLNCRFCRFEKCRRVGMKYHKPLDDVPSDVPQTSLEVPSVKQEVVTPSPADPAPSTVQYEDHRALMDTDGLYGMLSHIIEGNVINYGPSLGVSAFRVACLSTMQRLRYAYEELFASETRLRAASLQQVTKIDIKIILERTRESYAKYAKFLMASPHFAKLASADKWAIYRRATLLFVTFDTAYPTIATFGYDVNDRRIVFNDATCSNADSVEFSASGMSEDLLRKINKTFGKFPREVLDNLVMPMRRMRITEYELVYLQVLLIWNVRTIPEISENAKEVASRVVDEVSEALDSYYRNELRMNTYATRLVKLCTIQGEMEKYALRKKDAFEMGELFNTFECALYGSKFLARATRVDR